MRTFYISLWDDFGFEANFPGYYRAAVNMEYLDGAAVNTSPIQWHITGASTTMHVVAKLHGEQYGPAMFEFTLSSPVQYLNSGDTLTFAAKGMSVLSGSTITRTAPTIRSPGTCMRVTLAIGLRSVP